MLENDGGNGGEKFPRAFLFEVALLYLFDDETEQFIVGVDALWGGSAYGVGVCVDLIPCACLPPVQVGVVVGERSVFVAGRWRLGRGGNALHRCWGFDIFVMVHWEGVFLHDREMGGVGAALGLESKQRGRGSWGYAVPTFDRGVGVFAKEAVCVE
jgi:hypothetical protein